MKTFQLIQDRSFQIPMTASWPYIGYLLFIIKKAYDEFEERAGKIAAPRGEKTALIEASIVENDGWKRFCRIVRVFV